MSRNTPETFKMPRGVRAALETDDTGTILDSLARVNRAYGRLSRDTPIDVFDAFEDVRHKLIAWRDNPARIERVQAAREAQILGLERQIRLDRRKADIARGW